MENPAKPKLLNQRKWKKTVLIVVFLIEHHSPLDVLIARIWDLASACLSVPNFFSGGTAEWVA